MQALSAMQARESERETSGLQLLQPDTPDACMPVALDMDLHVLMSTNDSPYPTACWYTYTDVGRYHYGMDDWLHVHTGDSTPLEQSTL